jgi:hypothetical protein
MGDIGLVPYGAGFEMPYRVQGTELCNVIGVAPGRRPELAPVVLAAHYDTCGPLPGADDNAAAISIALRIAARLLIEPAERSVVVALFDGEEPPHFLSPAMGSIHWYHHQRRGPVHCAVVLDLVGHDVGAAGLEDLLFVSGMESDPALVFGDLDRPGVRVHPVLNRYIGDLSDHHVFRENGRPFLFLSCGRWQHYHSPTDTPEKLSYGKMDAIAVVTEDLVRRTCAAELVGPFGAGDTLALEVAAIERHFGGVMGAAARLVGRRGVDAFVAMAMVRFSL